MIFSPSLSSATILLLPLVLAAADKEPAPPPQITAEHYRVYRGDGSLASIDDILARAASANAVFLGENHDDPVAHHLEAELFKKLAAAGPVQLAMEMFESDTQAVLDEYLAGLITEDQLIAAGRAWKNYKQDYRPMVEFAKEKKLPVVAANAPRRYVNRVSRLGRASLDGLPDSAKQWLPPLPYAEPTDAYAAKFNKLREEAIPTRSASSDSAPKRDPKWGLDAQSLWDASMAFSVAEALQRRPGTQVVHVNGGFHTEQHMGIADHLRRYRPGVNILVVTMLSSKDFPAWNAEKHAGRGDFVIVTDEKLPRSYTPTIPTATKTETKDNGKTK
ncbi:MAG: ChaN family lipoprotein [Acidobacteria bacterium]|nr:ChaN family lipoprotein [Acidobacteriota bacterium]